MSWTKFDNEDEATWPPPKQLVLVLGCYGNDYALREWYPAVTVDADDGGWYDENNDLDDGIEPGDEIHWHPLPEAPA